MLRINVLVGSIQAAFQRGTWSNWKKEILGETCAVHMKQTNIEPELERRMTSPSGFANSFRPIGKDDEAP